MGYKVVMHKMPHVDEICAYWLLCNFGKEKFPGIDEATIFFGGAGGEDLFGCDEESLFSTGVILLGVGGGRFDEHPGAKTFGKENECSSSLVAQELGVEDDPALEPILRFVKNNDLKGGGQPFDLAMLTICMHRNWPYGTERVLHWVMDALDAKYASQVSFLETKAKLYSHAETESILGHGGRTLKLVTVVSDSTEANKVARADGADIVVQQNSAGQVQIYTNNKSSLIIYDLVQAIRVEEQRAKGQIVTTNWEELGREGKVRGVEEWYHHKPARMLLNGSLSCPDTPPTKLPLPHIKELVRISFDTGKFEPSRSKKCKAGKCDGRSCPWFEYGFHRCRKVRKER